LSTLRQCFPVVPEVQTYEILAYPASSILLGR
jgi:hypothetical protein